MVFVLIWHCAASVYDLVCCVARSQPLPSVCLAKRQADECVYLVFSSTWLSFWSDPQRGFSQCSCWEAKGQLPLGHLEGEKRFILKRHNRKHGKKKLIRKTNPISQHVITQWLIVMNKNNVSHARETADECRPGKASFRLKPHLETLLLKTWKACSANVLSTWWTEFTLHLVCVTYPWLKTGFQRLQIGAWYEKVSQEVLFCRCSQSFWHASIFKTTFYFDGFS